MRYFFITGLGRSGSAFLAGLLGLDPGARVEHEPFPDDSLHLPLAYYGTATACVRDYVRQRRRAIDARWAGSVGRYGEVNSLLRYFTDDLREVFDDPLLLFLVRDGRRYIESAYVRDVYTPDAGHAHIVPKDDDPWARDWPRFSRFEKLCWYWQHTNDHLAAAVGAFVRFEDILGDYAVLRDRVLTPAGVSIAAEQYRREIARPRNTTADFTRRRFGGRFRLGRRAGAIPPERRLGDWTPALDASFEAICGATMRRFGYGRDGAA
jgi:hypothetical protein